MLRLHSQRLRPLLRNLGYVALYHYHKGVLSVTICFPPKILMSALWGHTNAVTYAKTLTAVINVVVSLDMD